MKFRLCMVAALAVGCSAAADPARAQPIGAPWPFGAAEPGYADLPGAGHPPACAKLCFEDDSPCDPPVYKHADGRCETRNYGRR